MSGAIDLMPKMCVNMWVIVHCLLQLLLFIAITILPSRRWFLFYLEFRTLQSRLGWCNGRKLMFVSDPQRIVLYKEETETLFCTANVILISFCGYKVSIPW